MVPVRPDGARQRAGDRRALRALRKRGGGPPARAVVLQDHRLRRPAARGHGEDRVAAARRDDAGELDRPLGGRRGGVPLRGARDRLPRLHDPAGHAVRRDLLRARARAPGRPAAERLAGGARLREPRAHRVGRGARVRAQEEDGRVARADGHESGDGRGDPDVRGRLRAARVRHGRRDGRAGARRARLRLRHHLRHRDPPRDRLRRAAVHRRRADGELRALRRPRQPRGLRADRRLARLGGEGQADGELPAARLAAVAPALLGLPDPDDPLRDGRARAGAGRPASGRAAPRRGLRAEGQVAAGGGRGLGQHDLSEVRRAGAARHRHDGHLRRLVLVLPALLRPAQLRGAVGPRGAEATGCRSTSTSAGSSTRSCT